MLRCLAVALALAIQSSTVPHFDSNRAWEHLRQLVALGPRPAGSPALGQARGYIEGQLKEAGIGFTEQPWNDQTPAGPIHMVNVIATIPGASRDRIVIA